MNKVTFGSIESRIRRDLLNDNDPDQYRWSVKAVMSRMNQSVLDIALRINAWAAYNTTTGKRIYTINTKKIDELCNVVNAVDTDEDTTTLRALEMPLDARYDMAVAYLAAGMLLETDDSDTANAQKAAAYAAQGREYATR